MEFQIKRKTGLFNRESCGHSLTASSFNEYLLSACCVWDTVLCPGDWAVNETGEDPALRSGGSSQGRWVAGRRADEINGVTDQDTEWEGGELCCKTVCAPHSNRNLFGLKTKMRQRSKSTKMSELLEYYYNLILGNNCENLSWTSLF